MVSEKRIESYLVSQCKRIGALCWKWVSPSMTGVPDRIVIFHGHVYFVELKTEKGYLSKRQMLIHEKLRQHGAIVATLYSLEQVNEFVRHICENLQQ